MEKDSRLEIENRTGCWTGFWKEYESKVTPGKGEPGCVSELILQPLSHLGDPSMQRKFFAASTTWEV